MFFKSLASRFRQLQSWSPGSAADAEIVPQPKPRAVRQLFIVPSIGSRDIGRAKWPYVRCIEHFLQLLDFVNDALDVHAPQYSEP